MAAKAMHATPGRVSTAKRSGKRAGCTLQLQRIIELQPFRAAEGVPGGSAFGDAPRQPPSVESRAMQLRSGRQRRNLDSATAAATSKQSRRESPAAPGSSPRILKRSRGPGRGQLNAGIAHCEFYSHPQTEHVMTAAYVPQAWNTVCSMTRMRRQVQARGLLALAAALLVAAAPVVTAQPCFKKASSFPMETCDTVTCTGESRAQSGG